MPFTTVTRVQFLLSAVIRLKFHLGRIIVDRDMVWKLD